MHARVTTFRFRPDQVEAGVRFFADTEQQVRGIAGLRRAMLLLDRASQEAMTITLWESEADVQASAETVRDIFARAADYLSGPPERRTFEVAIDTGAA